MCGIVGFIGEGNDEDLKKMSHTLVHRGPDDSGHYIQNGIALAHRRLSIIDTSARGHQPMFDQNHTVGLVFNGEIYNFKELRQILEKKKVTFLSGTDTEVIIYLYKEYGEGAFEKMNGMFALALYDFKAKKLILARDRLGKKPLFWSKTKDTFVFGSELKAVLKHPNISHEIDLFSLKQYFLSEYVPTPRSILKGVEKLSPGTYLTFEYGQVSIKKYWTPNMVSTPLPLFDAQKKLDELLSHSVHDRLLSDVPLGVFLSGGIDSSTIAYYAKKEKQNVKTFSIQFADGDFDESADARLVAKHLGTDHHEELVSPKDILTLVPDLGMLVDEPLADASILPTVMLSRLARKDVVVALGGDGADELFAGYPTFVADRLSNAFSFIPQKARAFLSGVANGLPSSDGYFSFDFKLKRFLSGMIADTKYRHAEWLSGVGRADRDQLFHPEIVREIGNYNEYEHIDRNFEESKGGEPGNRVLYEYVRSYLLDGVLQKVDRASMFASLEVRAPFLDYKLVEFAFRLPYEYKLRGLTTKYILKKLMADRLPSSIVNKKKKGFAIPLSRWLKGELRPLCEDILSLQTIRRQALFNAEYVERIKKEHFDGKKDRRKELWALMVFQLWYQTYIKK